MDTAADTSKPEDDQPAVTRRVRLGQQAPRVPSRDGRSAESRLVRRVREELTRHVGGKPSATQKALIDRAAMLAMHIARMDARAVEAGGFSDHAAREYLAWSNTLARTIRILGLDAAPARPAALADVIAQHRRPAPP